MASAGRGRPARRGVRVAWFCATFAAVVAADQLTKHIMRDLLADGPVTLVPGVMDLSLVFNEGAAFGLGEGGAWLFVALAAAIALACAAYVVAGRPGAALSAALGAVAGGGVGNLVDRVATGAVTDFFKTTFVDFAVFNVADVAITCGFVVAFVLFWREDAARGRVEAPAGAGERAGGPDAGASADDGRGGAV